MRWFGARRREAEAVQRAAEHQAFLAALQTIATIVTNQSNMVEKVAEVLLAQYEMYQVEGKPTSRAHTDLTETLLEHERLSALREQGFPVDLDAVAQSTWVLRASDLA